jgi:hypothetical protein
LVALGAADTPLVVREIPFLGAGPVGVAQLALVQLAVVDHRF